MTTYRWSVPQAAPAIRQSSLSGRRTRYGCTPSHPFLFSIFFVFNPSFQHFSTISYVCHHSLSAFSLYFCLFFIPPLISSCLFFHLPGFFFHLLSLVSFLPILSIFIFFHLPCFFHLLSLLPSSPFHLSLFSSRIISSQSSFLITTSSYFIIPRILFSQC